MDILIPLIIGAVGGFLAHAVTMKVSFKQRTIDNKLKVYDTIIANWVRMRNFIYASLPKDPLTDPEFDKIYGESQTFIGEALLISEDNELVENINALNERLYRNEWVKTIEDPEHKEMESIKNDAKEIIKRMRHDIKMSTVFELSDFAQIFLSLFKKNKKGKINED